MLLVKTDLPHCLPIIEKKYIFITDFKRDPIPMDDTEKCLYKWDFNENAFNCFKQALFESSWNSVKNLKQQNEAYNKFLEFFT